MGKVNKKNKKPKDLLKDDISNKSSPVLSGKVEKKSSKEKIHAAVLIREKIESSPVVKVKKKKNNKKPETTIETKLKEEPVKDEITSAIVAAEAKKQVNSKQENTVFVGNVPSNTKKKQLQVLFGQFGKVISVRLRTSDGRKLFKHETRKKADTLNAYVVFDDVESSRKALRLTGTEFKGKHIRVTAAADATGDVEPKRILFVGNLKYGATDEKLYEIFETCGELEYVRTIRNAKGCNGVAYVCFKKPESVTLALELNNTMLDERPIRVQRYVKTRMGSGAGNKAAVPTEKKLAGSARRVMEKNKKLNKNIKGKEHKFTGNDNKNVTPKKEKKSDYRGVKIASKKKLKNKKKPTHLQNLAKKIAPK